MPVSEKILLICVIDYFTVFNFQACLPYYSVKSLSAHVLVINLYPVLGTLNMLNTFLVIISSPKCIRLVQQWAEK